jgi:hypothetical protein
MTKAGELILEKQTDAILSSDDGRRDGCVKWASFIPCLHCGMCCTGYQVQLSLIEARRICDGLGLSWYTFLGNYIEPYWTGADSFLLCQQDRVCVFLKHTNELYKTICLIHVRKPSACREWTPSLYRRECQAGNVKKGY